MQTVGTYEAKTGFTALLKRAASGERITIAKHGVPVATLQAFEAKNAVPVAEVIQALKDFRASQTLKGLTIRSLLNEGRR